MSFVARIDIEKHKLIWSKALLALSLLTDEIQFILRDDAVTLCGLHPSSTSVNHIVFNKSFFSEYAIDFTNCIQQGFDATEKTYSFVINKQPLSILFKNFDINSSITLRMSFDHQFKLFIDMKHLIEKKYQLGYQPVAVEGSVDYAKMYIDEYKQQDQEGSDPAVKYIMIDQAILKDFIDVVPSSTEELKIQVKSSRLVFNAFTKSVVKESQFLKQPMSSTISVSLSELLSTNIPEDSSCLINFKLKNLKIFISLVNLIHFNDSSDYFEIYFKQPGDLVVFNLSNNQHVTVNFLQLTNGEDDSDEMGSITKSYRIETVKDITVTHQRVVEHTPAEIDQIPNLDVDDFNDEFEATQYDEVKSIFG